MTNLNHYQHMKLFKSMIAAVCIASMFFTGSATLSSCEKEIIRDTIIKRDTIRIIDTVCHNLEDGLIAWYKFTGGSLKDSSGKNNDIVFNNASITTDRFGKPNNAYLFNGNGSYMKVNNSSSLNPKLISIMAVVKPNGFYVGPCHANNILSKGWPDFATGFYTVRTGNINNPCSSPTDVNNQYFSATFGDNGNPYGSAAGAAVDTVRIKANQWYNVVYTYDGTLSKFYIDGVLKDVRSKTTTASGNSQELFIGKHGDPQFPYWFNGVMDEIRIYEKVLTPALVAELAKLKN